MQQSLQPSDPSMNNSNNIAAKMLLGTIPLAMVEIQELGQVGSYMVDIMDIITSGKEILFNILISSR